MTNIVSYIFPDTVDTADGSIDFSHSARTALQSVPLISPAALSILSAAPPTASVNLVSMLLFDPVPDVPEFLPAAADTVLPGSADETVLLLVVTDAEAAEVPVPSEDPFCVIIVCMQVPAIYRSPSFQLRRIETGHLRERSSGKIGARLHRSRRSEEHTSELQSPDHLVCRL